MTAINPIDALARAWADLFQGSPLPADRDGVVAALDQAGAAGADAGRIERVRGALAQVEAKAYRDAWALWQLAPTLAGMTGERDAPAESGAAQRQASLGGRPVLAEGGTVGALGRGVQLADGALSFADLVRLAPRVAAFVPGVRWRKPAFEMAGMSLTLRAARCFDGARSVILGGRHGILGIDPTGSEAEIERELVRRLAEVAAGGDAHTGQRAVIDVLSSQYFTADGDEAGRAEVVAALATHLHALGLANAGEAALRSALGDVAADQVLAIRYFESPAYDRTAGGATSGVTLWGSDTRLQGGDALRYGTPGHIMATRSVDGSAAGEHFSYGPVPLQSDGSRRPGGDIPSRDKSVGVIPPSGPFRGAPPLISRHKGGMTYDLGADPFAAKSIDFRYCFDPRFIAPAAFDDAVRAERALEEAQPATRNYLLATAVVEPETLQPNQQVESRGAHNWLTIRSQHTSDTLQLPLHAQDGTLISPADNCVTTLMAVFTHLRSNDGRWLLDAHDFRVLGLSGDGRAQPGRDLRPQDLFAYLRFKEHRWLLL